MTDKRIALVTGAARGIGKAVAERLADEGCLVVAADLDDDDDEGRAPGADRLVFQKTDIARETDVKALFAFIDRTFGRLDVLVNNAGIIRDNLIWNMSADDFDAVLNVNLRGAWLVCREAAERMKAQKSGRIVNIASRAWLGNRGQTNYSASKAGLIGLTRALALELGRYGVSVNAVAPGLIDTPMTRRLEPEILQKLIEAQPTRAMGTPQDVARAVAFLAAAQTGFITGQTLYVDGGKSIGAG
ncbi:MAG: 3-oxoacyl-ACP reductase FabG [Thermoanaerobaculia bacterium]|nr:3-oxoacyl-ACP reductase FabG [Thermoanaerobaculia bacterium]